MTDKPIGLNEAQTYLERVIDSLHTLSADKKGPLVAVLEFLSCHIRDTRNEIAALRSGATDTKALASTTDELEEIVSETARATDAIMDAAEKVEKLSAHAPAEIAAELQAAATSIYEASAFQDITGQRISKVVHAMQEIETRLSTLVQACGDLGGISASAAPAAAPDDDEGLLNGPQLAQSANSQSEIDRLLSEF